MCTLTQYCIIITNPLLPNGLLGVQATNQPHFLSLANERRQAFNVFWSSHMRILVDGDDIKPYTLHMEFDAHGK